MYIFLISEKKDIVLKVSTALCLYMYIVYSHSEAQLYCSSIRVENEIAKSFFTRTKKLGSAPALLCFLLL